VFCFLRERIWLFSFLLGVGDFLKSFILNGFKNSRLQQNAIIVLDLCMTVNDPSCNTDQGVYLICESIRPKIVKAK